MISALTSPVIFACHCTIEPDRIVAGLLVLHEDCELGTHTLYNDSEPYPIALTQIPDRPYNVTLSRVPLQHVNQ